MNWKYTVIKKLGGFATLDDAIQEIKDKELSERSSILTLCVKRLYNTINAEDILREKGEEWLFEGKSLPKEFRDQIISEAAFLKKNTLWRILQKDIKYQANRQMFLLAKNEGDIIMGKMWLYVIDAINTRLTSLADKKSGTFNKK